MKRVCSLVALALLPIELGPQVAQATTARAAGSGVLALSGGVNASIRLNSANCVIGPGAKFSVYAVNTGHWGSLFLSAVEPRPGKVGIARVTLQGTGYRRNADAVVSWEWRATVNGGDVSLPALSITSNGSARAIDASLAVVRHDNLRKPAAVHVAVRWRAGDCKSSR